MVENDALAALGALAQHTRLEAFRWLVKHEPLGMPAGDIATALAVPANTLSTHLAVLQRSGLVSSERDGRVIRYRASISRLEDLMLFLARDCCAGHPGLCGPLAAQLTIC
jgi:ArsR family transcriptional regulator, arsenate/arsenite/antimonite-responsive transcriptional repressor